MNHLAKPFDKDELRARLSVGARILDLLREPVETKPLSLRGRDCFEERIDHDGARDLLFAKRTAPPADDCADGKFKDDRLSGIVAPGEDGTT